ncbi:unnamed protein product [Calypogeia fissa]
MTRAMKDANKRPVQAQSVKIQGGVKNGFKMHLNGPSGQDSNASIQGPKGHNYVINPAKAAKGQNKSINGGGLYIRAANNKKQLITATSCPDNQVQVQVGQGKAAVQLSIQVAPQGKRGEVELNCVRNEAEDGGTGYTVSVNSYKRKLDLHHHKPTISYLIGKRTTELFKEMRKTADLHPPAPPFVKF